MSAPKGVLLHGPPGCGKTMCAKVCLLPPASTYLFLLLPTCSYFPTQATAREAGARFINLDISSLTDKWYGESQKIAGAVFSLARSAPGSSAPVPAPSPCSCLPSCSCSCLPSCSCSCPEGPIWPVLFKTFAKNWFIRWKWSPLKRIAAKMRTYPA